MCKHDKRVLAKKVALKDMLKDSITEFRPVESPDKVEHVILTDEKVIGRNINKEINILIDLFM